MNGVGIVRKIDKIGRIVIPIELYRRFDLKHKDSVEFSTTYDTIVIKKHKMKCGICGSKSDLSKFKKGFICKECLNELKGNGSND